MCCGRRKIPACVGNRENRNSHPIWTSPSRSLLSCQVTNHSLFSYVLQCPSASISVRKIKLHRDDKYTQQLTAFVPVLSRRRIQGLSAMWLGRTSGRPHAQSDRATTPL